MSNVERQRRFRASHPGYFNKYKARHAANARAAAAAAAAAMSASAPAAMPTPPPPADAPAPLAMPPATPDVGVAA